MSLLSCEGILCASPGASPRNPLNGRACSQWLGSRHSINVGLDKLLMEDLSSILCLSSEIQYSLLLRSGIRKLPMKHYEITAVIWAVSDSRYLKLNLAFTLVTAPTAGWVNSMALFSQKESEGEGCPDMVPPFIISCLEELSTKSSTRSSNEWDTGWSKEWGRSCSRVLLRRELGRYQETTEGGQKGMGKGRGCRPRRWSGYHAPTLPEILQGLST